MAISDGLRQKLAGHIRVSTILPGFTDTAFSEHVKNPEIQEQLKKAGEKFAMSPDAVACAVAYVLSKRKVSMLVRSLFAQRRSHKITLAQGR